MPVRPEVTPPAGFEEVTPEELTDILGVGVHTGLRKGSDAEDAPDLWKAIFDSETSAWSDAARYAAWSLGYMGFKVYRPKREEDES